MVAVGEIAAGIGKREAVGATRHAAELADWLSRVLAFYPGRIMPFGLHEALHLRQLARAACSSGVEIGIADLMVPSIAVTADLAVATRNEKHFAALDVARVNPFEWEGSAAWNGWSNGRNAPIMAVQTSRTVSPKPPFAGAAATSLVGAGQEASARLQEGIATTEPSAASPSRWPSRYFLSL